CLLAGYDFAGGRHVSARSFSYRDCDRQCHAGCGGDECYRDLGSAAASRDCGRTLARGSRWHETANRALLSFLLSLAAAVANLRDCGGTARVWHGVWLTAAAVWAYSLARELSE